MSVQITKDTAFRKFKLDAPPLDLYNFDIACGANKLADIAIASAAPSGSVLRILRSANLMTMEVEEIGGSQYSVSYNIKFHLATGAYTAFDNLSNGADFKGTFQEFAEELIGYATLYQEALIDAEICPIEPYCSKMLDPRPLDAEAWYQRMPPEYRQPSLESILGWAADISTYCQLYNFLYDSGIDSMIEAYQAGVPIEDIIA